MYQVAIVGAGPIGLHFAAKLFHAGVDFVQLESGSIASTIGKWPEGSSFFSSWDQVTIGIHPAPGNCSSRPSRDKYLEYLKQSTAGFAANIRTHERVDFFLRLPTGTIVVLTRDRFGFPHSYKSRNLVLAIGTMHKERRLLFRGNSMPNVHYPSHFRFESYRGKRILIVGGRHTALQTALDCIRHGTAWVGLSYRRADLLQSAIKPWIYREVTHAIASRRIHFFGSSRITEVAKGTTLLRVDALPEIVDVGCDFVLMCCGYEADLEWIKKCNIALDPTLVRPRVNPETLETSIPGVYVIGTAVAGSQSSGYDYYIGNTKHHADIVITRILNSLKSNSTEV